MESTQNCWAERHPHGDVEPKRGLAPLGGATVQVTEDFQDGIASFIERRQAQFTGR